MTATRLSQFLAVSAVAVLASCGGETNSDLATTEFEDTHAVSTVKSDGDILSELYDENGTVVVTATRNPSTGDGSIELIGADASEFFVDPSETEEALHTFLYEMWVEVRDQRPVDDDVSFASVCYVGTNPKIQVSCGLVCDFPAPYSGVGRGPVSGYYSRSTCNSFAASCGRSVFYYYPRYYYGRWRTSCFFH